MSTLNTLFFAIVLTVFTCCNSNSKQQVSNKQNIEISPNASFNFDDNILNDWKIALTGKGKMCKWGIINDKGNMVLAQLSSETNGYRFNLITNNKLNYKDVEISVTFKGISGNEDQGGGPVWRYIDEKNYYVARANPLENNFRLYKVVDGDRIELESTNVEINSNKWYYIKIRMKDDNIKCYFNNKLELETTDRSFSDAGKIGFWTKSDAVTYFDNLEITAID